MTGASDRKTYIIFLLHAFNSRSNEYDLRKRQSEKFRNGSRGRTLYIHKFLNPCARKFTM